MQHKAYSKSTILIVSLVLNSLLLLGIGTYTIYGQQSIKVEKAYQLALNAAKKDCGDSMSNYPMLKCDNLALSKIESPDTIVRDGKSSWRFSFSAGDTSVTLWTSILGVDDNGVVHDEGKLISTPRN